MRQKLSDYILGEPLSKTETELFDTYVLWYLEAWAYRTVINKPEYRTKKVGMLAMPYIIALRWGFTDGVGRTQSDTAREIGVNLGLCRHWEDRAYKALKQRSFQDRWNKIRRLHDRIRIQRL